MMIEDFDGDVPEKTGTDGSAPSATPDLPQKPKKPSDIYRKSGIYYDDMDALYERKELSYRQNNKKSSLRKKYGEERKLLKPQKPPLFSQFSSADLKELKDETRVTVLIGSPEKDEMTIYLSPPTKADIKTADATHKMSQNKRHKTLRKAMENKNSWMVAYIMTVWREQDSNLDWVNPNYCFYHEWSSSRTFATVACRDSTVPVAALFLQTDAVNLHNDNGDCGDALWGAIHNEDPEQSNGIIKMLCRYAHLRISASDIQYAKTQTLRDLLTTEQAKRTAVTKNTETEAEAAAKALPESEKPDAADAAAEDGTVWKKLDNSSICKLTTDDSGFRLRKIFNFKSGTVSESHEYLNADGAVTTATPPTILRFGAVGSRREIEEAQKRLKAFNTQENTPSAAAEPAKTESQEEKQAPQKKAENRENVTVYPAVNPRAFM
ncbi:MAG: hypothetical protein EP349_04020 [Alphaproteobacteria bacterium]|nr:MAG: hypothetical protein EP349_04020 [Alphaproteobacteria bacterium]